MKKQVETNQKVRVFISSNIDSNYLEPRRELKAKLLETGLCEVFVFEETPGSSQSVEEYYLHYLQHSDLVVFLLGDIAKSGTLKEYKRSRDLKKKCIYVFCKEDGSSDSAIKDEIIADTHREKYKEVDTFAELAKAAFDSVLNDVVDIYLNYCDGLFMPVDATKDNQYEQEAQDLINVTSILTKPIYKGHVYIKLLLWNEIFHSRNHHDGDIIPFDEAAGGFLRVIMGSQRLDDELFLKLKREITDLHTGRIKKCVSLRMDALQAYWQGKTPKAIQILLEVLLLAKETKSMPTWFINNIALDLRQLSSMRDYYNNYFSTKPLGQQELDDSEEPCYYPMADRAGKIFYQNAFEDTLRNTLDSPFTVSFGWKNKVLDSLVDQYIASLVYGSIVHTSGIIRELADYLDIVSIQTGDRDAFTGAVRMMLLGGTKDKLHRFLIKFGKFSDTVDDADVQHWLECVQTMAIDHLRFDSEMALFKYFGDYLSDDNYNNLYLHIKEQIGNWFITPYAGDLIAKSFIDMLTEQRLRIGTKECVHFAYIFSEHSLGRWYDDVFKMLSKLNYEGLSEEEKKQLSRWLIELVLNEKTRTNAHLRYAIETLRLQQGDNPALDDVVKDYYKMFYVKEYSVNVFSHTSDDIKGLIAEQIEEIVDRNRTQGVNGHYIGYGYDPYKVIATALMRHEELDSLETKPIVDAILGTLSLKRQTLDDKYSALDLLIVLTAYYPKDKCIIEANRRLTINRQEYLDGYNSLLSSGKTTRVLDSMYQLLRILRGKLTHKEAIVFFSQLPIQETAETYYILSEILKMLQIATSTHRKISVYQYLILYLFEMAEDESIAIRKMAVASLIRLTLIYEEYREVVLGYLAAAMDNETYQVKAEILHGIKALDYSNKTVQFIVSKGRVDNHYWVRAVANSVGEIVVD